MRGTCSAGFELKAKGRAPSRFFPEAYDKIHAADHDAGRASVLVARSGPGLPPRPVERAQRFIRKAARGAGGQMPPGAAHFTAARCR